MLFCGRFQSQLHHSGIVAGYEEIHNTARAELAHDFTLSELFWAAKLAHADLFRPFLPNELDELCMDVSSFLSAIPHRCTLFVRWHDCHCHPTPTSKERSSNDEGPAVDERDEAVLADSEHVSVRAVAFMHLKAVRRVRF